MNTKDISIYESGDGGELAIIADDLLLGESFFNQIYLSLFGGNYDQSTKQSYLPTEEREDWWGNSLLFSEDTISQFNSETERALNEYPLNNLGRLRLIEAVSNDLKHLNDIANIEVDVNFFNDNKVKIIINFSAKANDEEKTMTLIYSNVSNEVIIEKTI